MKFTGDYSDFNKSGIYKILNTKNGKFYIGSTNNYRKRYCNHLRSLQRGDHNNSHLLSSWRKHGGDCFEMSLIEECSVDMLREREQYYLDTLTPYIDTIGYNLVKTSAVTEAYVRSMKGKSITPEHLAKLNEGLRNKGRTKEHCKNISKANMGRVTSPETRKKQSDKKKGMTISEDHLRKLLEGLARKGRTEEHGRNISKSLKGKTSEKRKIATKELALSKKSSDREVLRGIQLILDGMSATKASKELGFSPGFYAGLFRASTTSNVYIPLLHAIGYLGSGGTSVTDLAKPEVRAKINTNIEFPEGSDNLLSSAEEHLAFLKNIGLTDGPDNQRK